MKRFQNIFNLILDSMEKALFYFVSVLIVLVSSIVCIEIISRNIFQFSFVMVEELTMILLGWIAYFSAAYTVRKRGHVTVDFLYEKLNFSTRKIFHVVTSIAIIIFMAYILFASWDYMQMQMKVPLTQSRIPRGYIAMGLPFGTILIIFFTIADLIETLIFQKKDSLYTSIEKVAEELEQNESLESGKHV